MKSIILFTRYFPLSRNTEEFILQELQTVHKDYDITVVPFSKVNNERRELPENIKINTCLCDMNKYNTFIVLLKMFMSKYFWKSIFNKDFIKNCISISDKIYYIKILFGAQSIKHVIKNKEIVYDSATVFYSYWLTFAPLGFAYLKSEGLIKNKVIARTHGYEIYEKGHENPSSYPHFPLRDFTYKWIDNIYSISQKGVDILKSNYPNYANKYKISHLGVDSLFSDVKNKKDKKINILSCSYLYPLKRVPLIYTSLYNYSIVNPDISIKWYHIGTSRNDDNKGFESLKNMAISTSNLEVCLLGQMLNNEVLKFYQGHHLDIFINISTTEGIPVSIMEALSAGLAIIATNVGSNNEIVTTNVGRLLNVDFSQEEFNNALSDVIDNVGILSTEALKEYNNHWNKDVNYKKFYREITE